MRSFVFALLFLMPVCAIGGGFACKTDSGTVTTDSARECRWKRINLTEDQLNETYKRVLGKYAELAKRDGSIVDQLNQWEETRSTLVAAQQAWVTFRAAECRYVYIGVGGETPLGEPMAEQLQGVCMQARAKERIRQLEASSSFIERHQPSQAK